VRSSQSVHEKGKGRLAHPRQDATGKQLDNTGLKSVVVELSDGQKFPAHFGGHPPSAPTDYLWSTSWSIPADYPTGTFN
jgi:hypothetical protein